MTHSFPSSALVPALLLTGLAPIAAAQTPSLSTPRPVHTDAATDFAAQQQSVLVLSTNENSTWVCISASRGSVGGGGVDQDIVATHSSDYGATWSGLVAIGPASTDGADEDAEPDVGAVSTSTYILVWASQRASGGDDYDIFNARGSWSGTGETFVNVFPMAGAVAAQNDTAEDRNPHVAANSTSTLVAVWEHTEVGGDTDLWFARSTNLAVTWSAGAPLNASMNTDSGQDRRARIAFAGSGEWVVLWDSTDDLGNTIGGDTDVLISRSIDDGLTWSAPAALESGAATDGGDSDLAASLTHDTNGNWLVAWGSGRSAGGLGTDTDILVSRSGDYGLTWSAAAPLNSDATTDGTSPDANVRVATDTNGTWCAVWERSAAFGTDIDLLQARSTDAGLTWSAPACANTNCATDDGGDFEASLASDRHGRFGLTWTSNSTLGGTIGTDRDLLRAYLLLPDSIPLTYCQGRDAAGPRCPCGNDSTISSRAGCLNSTGNGGGLSCDDVPSLGAGTIRLRGVGMPSGASALYFMGTAMVNGGDGTAFGDGLRCVGGSILRLGIRTVDGTGHCNLDAPSSGLAPGDLRFYQVWYRNAAAFCTPSTFNLSNGLCALWGA